MADRSPESSRALIAPAKSRDQAASAVLVRVVWAAWAAATAASKATRAGGVAGRIVAHLFQGGEVGEAAVGRRAVRFQHGGQLVAGGFEFPHRGAEDVLAEDGGGGLAQGAGLDLLGGESTTRSPSSLRSTTARLPHSLATRSAEPSGAARRPVRGRWAASFRIFRL